MVWVFKHEEGDIRFRDMQEKYKIQSYQMPWLKDMRSVKPSNKYGPVFFENEEDIKNYIMENWKHLFDFWIWTTEYRINRGNKRVDVVGYDFNIEKPLKSNRNFYMIELKFHEYRKSDKEQLQYYVDNVDMYGPGTWMIPVGILINYENQYLVPRIIRKG